LHKGRVLIVQFRFLLILFSLIAGVGITLWGLFQESWSAAPPFALDLFHYNIILFIIGQIIIEVISKWMQVCRLASGAVIGCIIAIFAGAIWPLFVSVWFALASFILGLGILSALNIDSKRMSAPTTFLIGACVYGTVVGLMAHFPINYPGTYGILLAIPVVIGRRFVSQIRSLSRYLTQSCESRWLESAIVLVALVHFSVALMPEVGHDALAMHLFIPGHLAHRHEWGFDVNNYVWAVMPMMGDWLFSIGYMLAGETAARLINVGFIFVLCRLIYDLVMWAGGNAIGGRWAILLFLTTPLTYTISSSLFIESIWASFIVAGSISVFKLIQSQDDQNKNLMVAGILLGGALSAKAVTLNILPVLLFFIVLRYHNWIRWNLVPAVAMGIFFFLATGIIPYATAWHLTGNPVFPFFNQIFQSPFYPAINFDSSQIFGKGLTWDVFYQATFYTEKFMESRPGAVGFQWLLLFFPAILLLIFYRLYWGIIIFIAAVLSVASTFQSVTYLRYVFPSFAWIAGGIGVALSTGITDSIIVKRSLVIAGWTVVVLNLVFFRSGTYYGDLSLKPLVSSSGREAYLNARLPIRNAVELVNRLNLMRTPVAIFSSPLTAGMSADGLYPNWYNHKFQKLVNEAQSSISTAQLLLGKGVDYVILDENWGSADQRKRVAEATEKLAEFGAITVRMIKSDYRFQTELLTNPDFSTYEGWTLSSGEKGQPSGRLTTSVLSPAFQIVSVIAGRRYKNIVTAVCPDQPSKGRLQVNWLDEKSNFIKTDISVFDCTSSEITHSMEAIAPKNASKAVVYASGHTDVPVNFRKVSFRK
jgi:hypothetical protein